MLSFTISRHFGIPLRYLLVVLLHISCTLSTSICYNRNSVQVDGWLPCAPDVDNGPCCPLGWICLSNGLCQPTPSSLNHHDISYFRPHCTDPSWNTTSCFSGCNSGEGYMLNMCGGGNYCCFDTNGCDCSKASLYELGPATFKTTLPTETTTSMTATSPSPSVNVPLSVSVSTTTSNTSITAIVTSITSVLSQPTTDSNTELHISSSNGKNTAVCVGVSVGISIPLIVFAIGLAISIRRRKRDIQRMTAEGKVKELETSQRWDAASESHPTAAHRPQAPQARCLPQEMPITSQ